MPQAGRRGRCQAGRSGRSQRIGANRDAHAQVLGRNAGALRRSGAGRWRQRKREFRAAGVDLQIAGQRRATRAARPGSARSRHRSECGDHISAGAVRSRSCTARLQGATGTGQRALDHASATRRRAQGSNRCRSRTHRAASAWRHARSADHACDPRWRGRQFIRATGRSRAVRRRCIATGQGWRQTRPARSRARGSGTVGSRHGGQAVAGVRRRTSRRQHRPGVRCDQSANAAGRCRGADYGDVQSTDPRIESTR